MYINFLKYLYIYIYNISIVCLYRKFMLITDSFNENNEESVNVGLRLCDKIDNKEYIYANFIVYFRNYNNNQIYKEIEYGNIYKEKLSYKRII